MCKCKTGCATKKCSCKKSGKLCDDQCGCGDTCRNKASTSIVTNFADEDGDCLQEDNPKASSSSAIIVKKPPKPKKIVVAGKHGYCNQYVDRPVIGYIFPESLLSLPLNVAVTKLMNGIWLRHAKNSSKSHGSEKIKYGKQLKQQFSLHLTKCPVEGCTHTLSLFHTAHLEYPGKILLLIATCSQCNTSARNVGHCQDDEFSWFQFKNQTDAVLVMRVRVTPDIEKFHTLS